MKKIWLIHIPVILLSIVFLVVSCKHEYIGLSDGGNNTPPVQTSICSADTVYFANTIQPMIVSSCAMPGCHDAATRAEGVQLNSYNNIRGYVVPMNASSSKLYKVCVKSGSERMPLPPLPALSASQLSTISKWINQGALNNQCTGDCDTTVFNYAASVSIIMNTFCKGCHNPASLGGNIDLSTYASVKAQALNGKLMGSIGHLSGFSAMPKGGNKLLDCQIRQVEKWIQAGTPDN